MKHINLFEGFLNESTNIKLFSQINESIEDEYNAMIREKSAKTKPLRDKRQRHYDDIRKIQEDIKKIEDSYKEKSEALRKKAVETEPEAGFLSKHDMARFNPAAVKKSAELTQQIIDHIISGKKKMDEDDIYEVTKKIAGTNHILHTDISKIYQAVQDAGLYISGE